MQLRVRSISYLAEAINGYELVDPRGRDLPRFAAGAHIDLRFADFVRQYSLCNDPAERRRYCIAVLREDASRGGARYLHETIRAGDLVEAQCRATTFRSSRQSAAYVAEDRHRSDHVDDRGTAAAPRHSTFITALVRRADRVP
jgi:vanillate O-demethylase ferredoxin subunit